MFSKIIDKYFQNHIENNIPLSSGLNVFLGSSDQGKSVIVRLIKWIKDNRPSGISFKHRKFPNKTTRAIIDLMEPKLSLHEGTIERARKDNKTNYYKLNGTKLNALNKKVPSEITKALNISDINIQEQFDQFFLLQDSPGTVAKKLNEFVGLELIDIVRAETEKRVRKYNNEVISYEKTLKELKKKKKRFKFLPKAKEILTEANNLDGNILALSLDIDKLENILYALNKLQKEKKKFANLKDAKIIMKEVLELNNSISNLNVKENTINNILFDLERLQKKKKKIGNITKAKEVLVEIKSILNDIKNYDRAIVKVREYTDSILNLMRLNEENKRSMTFLKDKLRKIHKVIKICPTCKRKWVQR